jgi:hypothetical protein
VMLTCGLGVLRSKTFKGATCTGLVAARLCPTYKGLVTLSSPR